MQETYPITQFGGARGENATVIYTEGKTTNTNRYGWEASVQDGRVLRCGQNNSVIPKNGFVVSAHGTAAVALAEALSVGTKVTLDREKMQLLVENDPTARQVRAQTQIDTIKARMDSLLKSGEPFDRVQTEELLQKAESAMHSGAFAEVNDLTENAYYLTTHSSKGEVRAIWHRPYEQSDEQVEQTVLRFRNAGFNRLLIETNYEGYANAQKCVSKELPIRPCYANGFDVIDAFIRIGKAHGMEIHAWYENFFFGVESTGCPMAEVHPEWMARRKDGGLLHDAYDTFYFLNPALPEVRAYLLSCCRKLLDSYDFDGFQLDYIRYPVGRGIERTAGFEEQTKALFEKECGIRLDDITDTESKEWETFTAWRAEKVTSYVHAVRDLIMEYRSKGRYIQLSTAVFGEPEAAVRLKCQDWRHWVEQGWLDAIYPMAYLNDAQDVKAEVAYMVSRYGQAPNISGISPMYNHLPMIESTKQVEACREAGAKGVAFFATQSCTDEQLYNLKRGVFRTE